MPPHMWPDSSTRNTPTPTIRRISIEASESSRGAHIIVEGKHVKLRKIAMRTIAACTVAAGTMLGVGGTATAAPAPAQGVWMYTGGQIFALGQNAWCTGVFDTLIETDHTRPGYAVVSITPRGMRGLDPEWSQNPVCNVSITLGWVDGIAPFQHFVEIPFQVGDAPGETVRTEINPGSGLVAFSINAGPISPDYSETRPQYSYPAVGYFLIP